MFDLEATEARLRALYGTRVREVRLTDRKHCLHVLFSGDGQNGVWLEARKNEFEKALNGLSSRRLDDLLLEASHFSQSAIEA